MRKKRFFCISVVFLLFTSQGFILPVQPAERYDKTNNKQIFTNSITQYFKKDIPIIYISATSDYDYGLKEGQTLYDYYSIFIKFAKICFKNIFEQNKYYALNHIETLYNYYPSYLKRLKGISDALGVPLIELVTIDMLFSSLFSKLGACTTTAVSSEVTSDSQAYVSWNIDLYHWYKIFFSHYIRPPPLIICDIEGKYKYVKFTILPSIFSFGLLNEYGLSYVGSTVETKEKADGLSSLELNNLAMETCKTINDVQDLYCNSVRASGLVNLHTMFGITANLNTLWADSNGDILLIEYNHSHIITKKDVIFAEANHYQFLNVTKNNNGDNTLGFTGSSKMRLERAYELLHLYNGSIDADFYQNILTRDHEKGQREGKPDRSDLCRHSILYATLCVILTLPKKLALYYCPGHPCRVSFRYLDFSEELADI